MEHLEIWSSFDFFSITFDVDPRDSLTLITGSSFDPEIFFEWTVTDSATEEANNLKVYNVQDYFVINRCTLKVGIDMSNRAVQECKMDQISFVILTSNGRVFVSLFAICLILLDGRVSSGNTEYSTGFFCFDFLFCFCWLNSDPVEDFSYNGISTGRGRR
jgi:hypothetical protein